MSDAAIVSADQTIWRPAVNPWLIAVTVSLAAFMEVLDTAIARVALPHIAGNLGASNDPHRIWLPMRSFFRSPDGW
jgi:DHA2 family multidrug resistance protein